MIYTDYYPCHADDIRYVEFPISFYQRDYINKTCNDYEYTQGN